MTREDINDIINAICPNDEDYEKTCISPKYLREELEQLALDQRQWNEDPTTKNNIEVNTDKLISDCEEMSFDIDIFDKPLKVVALAVVKNIVKNLPSVTPQEPRKGHWKLVQRGKSIDVCCSNCEAVRIEGYAYNYTIDQLNKEDFEECFECADMRYCPNCGAKMESED